MDSQKHEMILRERKIDMLQVLALQDDIWERSIATLKLVKLGNWPRPNDDDTFLAIVAIVGTLAELALRVEENDLGALAVEVDQAWKRAVAKLCH
jgi:hypothetical protein